MVSFDYMPETDEGVMRMARYDLSRMKKVAKEKRAVTQCNAYRVQRAEQQVVIDFLYGRQPEEMQIKLRFIYELMPPFR